MSRQPGWFIGMLIVFALATAGTMGLFLWKHAENAAMWERYRMLQSQIKDANELEGKLKGIPALKEQAIVAVTATIKEAGDKEKEGREDIDRLIAANIVTKDKIGEKCKAEAKAYAQLLADAKARRLELKQEEERALATERDQDKKRLDERDVIEALSRQVETTKRDARKANFVNDQRVDELAERIAELTRQRETHLKELRSDGQIIASRAAIGYVVIDKGQQHNLRKGTRFAVYNLLSGRYTIKGSIEVVEVEARLAVCRVIEEKDANNPLVPGDHIHNPVYNPTDIKTFVIKGDFFKFSKDELARFITDSGAKVAPELTTRTDYLVAGERADKALADARKIGVSIISEDQLLEFVRYTPKFAIRQGMIFVLKGSFTTVSEAKIKSFILDNGGRVESDLDRHTSVLVAGDGAVEEIGKARLLGATVVDQSTFAHLATAAGGKK